MNYFRREVMRHYGLLVFLALGIQVQAIKKNFLIKKLQRKKKLPKAETSIRKLQKDNKLPKAEDGKLTLTDLNINDLKGLSKVPGIEKVRILDLSRNKITKILQRELANLKNLEVLLLSSNNIKDIPNNTFGGLVKLSFIDLAQNNITFISPTAFAGLPLSWLTLFGNELSPELQKELEKELSGVTITF